MFSRIFWLHCNTFECFAMFRVQFSTFFSVKSSCALVTREEMVISSQARFLPGRKLPFPPGWRVRMTISRKKIEISFGHRLYRVIQEYLFTNSWRNGRLGRAFFSFDFAPFQFCLDCFIIRFNMMAKTQILDAVFMTTVHFLKSLKEPMLFFFYKESMNFLFSKVVIVLRCPWLAVELLREPIRGQLKTITKKELDFGGPRICSS